MPPSVTARPTRSGLAEAYVAALAESALTATDPDRTIKTLAPSGPKAVRAAIQAGEQALRKGETLEATSRFQLAYDLAPRSPEAALSLFHSQVAAADQSYAAASYLLGRTLRLAPELPLAPLHPQHFFAGDNVYARHVQRLEAYGAKHDDDAGAWLVAAYFRWFGDDPSSAVDALARARRAAPTDDIVEAIDIFSDAIAASGQGDPGAPETQPASAEAGHPSSPAPSTRPVAGP